MSQAGPFFLEGQSCVCLGAWSRPACARIGGLKRGPFNATVLYCVIVQYRRSYYHCELCGGRVVSLWTGRSGRSMRLQRKRRTEAPPRKGNFNIADRCTRGGRHRSRNRERLLKGLRHLRPLQRSCAPPTEPHLRLPPPLLCVPVPAPVLTRPRAQRMPGVHPSESLAPVFPAAHELEPAAH
ncbi:hypothetical protein CALVIDRAFT_173300 [Calocera viscosa TUFC12733]|uniref:Uncharacterized protein n=1 Tax=Calocera viscosa (strain TUFC12733) TaxID=1330018 RepID=A0A167KYD1_CALVF|nr:hypothetical protein CALVIDRAFT_173300 [Calocera viscosa TUFC12733]